ncbi:MAG: F0F1 ATP synthase subunit B [Rhizobiaceae bacterium]
MFVVTAYAATDEDATHTETGVAHEGEHAGTFPPFDSATFPSQILWLAITFGLFFIFLKKVVLPRISDILEHRSDRIAQDLDQAARMKEEADEAMAAYEQELAEGRAKAGQIGQEARDSAKAEADADRRKVEAGLEKKLTEAEARIASIKAAAMKEVGTIAEDTAVSIVERLIGGKIGKAEASSAVKAIRS